MKSSALVALAGQLYQFSSRVSGASNQIADRRILPAKIRDVHYLAAENRAVTIKLAYRLVPQIFVGIAREVPANSGC